MLSHASLLMIVLRACIASICQVHVWKQRTVGDNGRMLHTWI
jgi:hypothetical protein